MKVDYYMEQIDNIMHGRCDARMALFYLDAVNFAAQRDLKLDIDDYRRVRCQVENLQKIIMENNPGVVKTIGKED